MPRDSDIFAIKYNPIWGTRNAKKSNSGSLEGRYITEEGQVVFRLFGWLSKAIAE
jgi:hypothetical protein